jgi:hypothetical protein
MRSGGRKVLSSIGFIGAASIVLEKAEAKKQFALVILTIFLGLSAVATASTTKKKFLAQVNSDSGCPTGISLTDSKSTSPHAMCVIDYPPAAVRNIKPYLGSTVEVEGIVYANSSITLKKIAKKKVYDPCALGAAGIMGALGAGMAGVAPPPLPADCAALTQTGATPPVDESSISSEGGVGANSGASSAAANVSGSNLCTRRTTSVRAESRMMTGPGHCAGEVDAWFTNVSNEKLECGVRFHRNGHWDSSSGLEFSLSPGEKVGGFLSPGGVWTCGADNAEVVYDCFPYEENQQNYCLQRAVTWPQ